VREGAARARLPSAARIFEDGIVGLISFSDSAGVRWRVWQVETPAARAHLMEESYRGGWLVFEREDGGERRRYSGLPDGWESLTPDRLNQLCTAAAPVALTRTSPTGQQAVWSRAEADSRRER
jgi:hypothetical protein